MQEMRLSNSNLVLVVHSNSDLQAVNFYENFAKILKYQPLVLILSRGNESLY